jgi:hypothetical protein
MGQHAKRGSRGRLDWLIVLAHFGQLLHFQIRSRAQRVPAT